MREFSKTVLFVILLSVLASSCQNEAEPPSAIPHSQFLFEKVDPAHTSIEFSNVLTEDRTKNVIMFEYFFQGSGIAIGDLDNDGLQDVYFAGNLADDKIYKNEGNFVFQDVTGKSGINTHVGWNCGVNMVDINSDGFLDIYICRGGEFKERLRGNLLYINKGNFIFEEKSSQYGLNDTGHSMQSAFFDFDKDGDLDVYVTNTPRPVSPVIKGAFADKSTYGPANSDKLYLNNGNNTFSPVIKEAGLVYENGYGLGIAIGDYNNDGWEDLYIANDYDAPDLLYINQKNGKFSESLTAYFKHTSNNSMGCASADFNRDGNDDIIVLDMLSEDYKRSKVLMSTMNVQRFWNVVNSGGYYQYMRNTLQINNGNNTFSEIGQFAGIAKTDWSWSPLVGDFDNDGLQDIYVTNGIVRDITNRDFQIYSSEQSQLGDKAEKDILNVLKHMPSNKLRNYAFKNNGDLTFSITSQSWGLDDLGFSTGTATADLDNDGDLDIITTNTNDKAFVYKNNSKSNFLTVQLKGQNPNPHAIGASVVLYCGDYQQKRNVQSQSGYLSSSTKKLHFGLGDLRDEISIEVTWPDGQISRKDNLQLNTLVIVDEKDKKQKIQIPESEKAVVFIEDKSGSKGLNILHIENEFDDYQYEILLPYNTSRYGPKMAKGDVNGDGLDDFVVGSSSGIASRLFIQIEADKFQEKKVNDFIIDKDCEDAELLLFDADQDNDMDLYIVSGGNEHPKDSEQYNDRIYINDGSGNFVKKQNSLPKSRNSGSCVQASDFDMDGDLDLFVGTRIIPRNYGKIPTCQILENRNGKFNDVTEKVAPDLLNLGMVTSAQWIDFDNDNDDDLVIAGEWMPVSFYRNDNSTFTDVTKELMDIPLSGFWNAMDSGDFNNDNLPDFVLGNFGLNTKFQASLEHPLNLFVSDFDESGSSDIVLSSYYEGKLYPIRGRECLSWQMPYIKEKFATYESFAESDMEAIYGSDHLDNAINRTINTLASGILMSSKEGKYTFVKLPREGQLAPIFSFLVLDLNNDGFEDIVGAGNFYAPEVETGRFDSGNGFVLLGDGSGNFSSLSLSQSGLFAPNEVRDLLLLNDQQGNLEKSLLISNNNGPFQVFNLQTK